MTPPLQRAGAAPETLARIVAPSFVAGIVLRGGVCVEAAPILRRACLGRTRDELRALFAKRGWAAGVVRDGEAP